MNNNLLLNRVFSQSTLNEIVDTNSSRVLEKACSEFLVGSSEASDNLLMQFKHVYSYIEKEYRNEYYFKNTLLNKLLLGVHSINTSTALTELPVSDSIADFILINGKAVVFEIKTEQDNLTKLRKQVSDYYKVFDHVVILSVEKYKERLLEDFNDSPVGVSILTKRNTISIKKQPDKYRDDLDYESMYKVLRKNERKEILLRTIKKLPVTNQFSEFDDYLEKFKNIGLENAYEEMIHQLKNRKNFVNDKELFEKIPYEIKALYYFSKLSRSKKEILKTMLEGA